MNLQNNNPIRIVKINNIEVGGDTSFSFMNENDNKTKAFLGVEILYNDGKNLSEDIKKIEKSKADFISIKINIENIDNIDNILKKLKEIPNQTTKSIIIRGANNTETDAELLPKVSDIMPKDTVIAFGDEITYEKITKAVIKNDQILVLRSPIDINIAKELNILATDLGMNPNKILIDTDMGGLGYGLDYGYSIIERIRQAGFSGDEMLNMPVIIFLGEEIFKAKEVKSNTFDSNWGIAKDRHIHWELSAATALISAGANIVILNNIKTVNILKEVF